MRFEAASVITGQDVHIMYIVTIKAIINNQHEAGGGFLEPLAAFYYFDKLLENHKKHGCLLTGGSIVTP